MANKQNYQSSQLYKIRHSLSHVMAQAVLDMFPTGKIAIGPPIEDGFYYDFDREEPFTPDDFERIEAKLIFDENRRLIERQISGGDFITAEDFEAAGNS